VHILAIDQGTSSTKALVLGEDLEVLAVAEEPVTPVAGDGGAVEQDPRQLFNSVVAAGSRALAEAGVEVDAIGLANQGETVLAWDDQTGEPLCPALSWQDRRAADLTERISEHETELHGITGLPLDPYFSAPKFSWLRSHLTKGGRLGTSDAWLMRMLTGHAKTDASTASRSLVFDLGSSTWSPRALEIFGLGDELLPDIVPCAGDAGTTSTFGPELSITGLMVDQQAALLGEGCTNRGDAKCTYGTGAFFLVNVGDQPLLSDHGLSTSVAWSVDEDIAYCLDGQIYTAGAAVTWLSAMGLLSDASQLDSVAGSAADDQVTVVPSFAGLGAPQWKPEARASIEGMTLSTTPADIVRATLFGLAAQVALMVESASGEEMSLRSLRVDGGLTRSAMLMQMQSDLLQIPVEVYDSPHATAIGVAAMARHGLDPTISFAPLISGNRTVYEPAISEDQARTSLATFEASVRRVQERVANG
jgi:glycerol kinase